VNPAAVQLARRNLSLVTPAGLTQRASDLDELAQRYGKLSHREAAATARRLARDLLSSVAPETHVVEADATNPGEFLCSTRGFTFDIVIADVPYGRTVEWQGRAGATESTDAISSLLRATAQIVTEHGQWAIVTPARVSTQIPEGFTRCRRRRIGHREVHIINRNQDSVQFQTDTVPTSGLRPP